MLPGIRVGSEESQGSAFVLQKAPQSLPGEIDGFLGVRALNSSLVEINFEASALRLIGPGPQSLPGLHKVQSRMDIPLDPPVTASRKTADPARLEDEAEELARLSAGIPAQIHGVNLRLMPKDLDSQLKRIEKLAKHLRSQVSP